MTPTPDDPAAIDLDTIKAKRIGNTAGCTSRKMPFDPWRNLHPQDIDKLIAAVEALRKRIEKLDIDATTSDAQIREAQTNAWNLRVRAGTAEARVEAAEARVEEFRDDAIKWREGTELTTKWRDQWEAERARVMELTRVLEGCNELFDNYGFASESPCIRDREIIANMLSALATTPTQALERARAVENCISALRYYARNEVEQVVIDALARLDLSTEAPAKADALGSVCKADSE